MTEETLTERMTKTKEGMRLYQQERALQEMTDLVCHMMDEKGCPRERLAYYLNWDKESLDGWLDGQATSLREVSDVFAALGCSIHFHVGKLEV